MKNLKELFKNKQKLDSLTERANELSKKHSFFNIMFVFVGIYISLIAILGITSGYFFQESHPTLVIFVAFFMPIMLALFSTKAYDIIKQKLNKVTEKESKFFYMYEINYNKEFHELIKENKEYFEIFKKENQNKNLFLSYFYKLIKESSKEEIIELRSEIELYLKEELEEEQDTLKHLIIDIIDRKINDKEKINEIDNKLNNIFEKEEKKKSIIKSI